MLTKLGERSVVPNNTSWLWSKKLFRVLFAACVVACFFVLWNSGLQYEEVEDLEIVSNITIASTVNCEVDIDLLRRLDIKKLSQYVRREVIATRSSEELPLTQFLDTPIFELNQLEEKVGGLLEQSQDDCLSPRPVSVQVPLPPGAVDASHIDFGVATTLSRLNDSLDAFSHWAGYTRTRIFALIEPDDRVTEVQTKANLLGINLFVTQSEEEYQTRYFSLVKHLAMNMRDQTRWSVVIDDDTFFLSMAALVTALEGYDHTQPTYIGGVSESIPQIGLFGLMGFGGAGVFLSRPLIQKLSEPEIFEACREMDFTGDRRISLCIYQYTETHLTIDYRLRQLDIMGDVTGFFEAQRPPPLSVHHWKSWFHADMAKLSKVSKICGDACLLRKWRFTDGWILTNGFSITMYSSEVSPDDRSMELTWEGDHDAVRESFLHALGPLRAKDKDKITYLLEESVVDGDYVRQWYVRRDAEHGAEVIELMWRKG